MPTYSYRCRDCDVAFDIQQSFDEDTLTVCPNCQGSLRKLFNTVGVVFKGSGFYRNDSREAGKSSPPAGGTGTSGAKKPDSGKSDSGSSNSGSSGSGTTTTSGSGASGSNSSGSGSGTGASGSGSSSTG